MANAARDENRVTVLMGASSSDGTTPTAAKADPTAHYVFTDDDTTGSDLSGDIAPRDQNFVPVAIAASESDGITPVVLYVNGSGELLIDST
jgi:hypothetical protein